MLRQKLCEHVGGRGVQVGVAGDAQHRRLPAPIRCKVFILEDREIVGAVLADGIDSRSRLCILRRLDRRSGLLIDMVIELLEKFGKEPG